jgi:AraC-like DNA-binding protein
MTATQTASPVAVEAIAPEAATPLPAIALTGFRALVEELGGDPSALLAAAGIDPSTPDRPEDSIALLAMARLLDDCATRLACPDFAMRLAARQEALRMIAPFERLYTHAPTLRDAFAWSASHNQIYSAAIRVATVHDCERQLYAQRYQLPGEGLPMFRQLAELVLLLSQDAVVAMSGGLILSHEIWLSHPPIASPAIYRAHFRATVKFGQEFDGLFFTEEEIDARLIVADQAVFRSERDLLAARYPRAQTSFANRAREAAKLLLADGGCTRESLAAALNMSVSTLHRRLGDAGYSFENLRDEIRRNLALRYLLCTELSLTEVAAKLGYADPAVLTRSCRRWFDATPSAVRRGQSMLPNSSSSSFPRKQQSRCLR